MAKEALLFSDVRAVLSPTVFSAFGVLISQFVVYLFYL